MDWPNLLVGDTPGNPPSGVKNPHYRLPPLPPRAIPTHTRMGYFFQNTKYYNRGFKTLDCPPLLVVDTPGIPLTLSGAKTHIYYPPRSATAC